MKVYFKIHNRVDNEVKDVLIPRVTKDLKKAKHKIVNDDKQADVIWCFAYESDIAAVEALYNKLCFRYIVDKNSSTPLTSRLLIEDREVNIMQAYIDKSYARVRVFEACSRFRRDHLKTGRPHPVFNAIDLPEDNGLIKVSNENGHLVLNVPMIVAQDHSNLVDLLGGPRYIKVARDLTANIWVVEDNSLHPNAYTICLHEYNQDSSKNQLDTWNRVHIYTNLMLCKGNIAFLASVIRLGVDTLNFNIFNVFAHDEDLQSGLDEHIKLLGL